MIGDVYLGASLRNNLLMLLVVPVTLALAAVLASVMNRGIYGRAGARALYFLPYVTNIVAIATVWRALFHATAGPINMFFKIPGCTRGRAPGWLSDMKWALPAIMIILLWKDLGYYILMYSAGLQNIPNDYYEAADVDGASAIQKFLRITVPLLSPTTFLLTTLGVISSLQMWALTQIVTFGGPGTATYTLATLHLPQRFYHLPHGLRLGPVLAAVHITLVITLIQWRGQKSWVNY